MLEPKLCLQVSSPWEIFVKGMMPGYQVSRTEIDSLFLSVSLGLQKVMSLVNDTSWRWSAAPF